MIKTQKFSGTELTKEKLFVMKNEADDVMTAEQVIANAKGLEDAIDNMEKQLETLPEQVKLKMAQLKDNLEKTKLAYDAFKKILPKAKVWAEENKRKPKDAKEEGVGEEVL